MFPPVGTFNSLASVVPKNPEINKVKIANWESDVSTEQKAGIMSSASKVINYLSGFVPSPSRLYTSKKPVPKEKLSSKIFQQCLGNDSFLVLALLESADIVREKNFSSAVRLCKSLRKNAELKIKNLGLLISHCEKVEGKDYAIFCCKVLLEFKLEPSIRAAVLKSYGSMLLMKVSITNPINLLSKFDSFKPVLCNTDDQVFFDLFFEACRAFEEASNLDSDPYINTMLGLFSVLGTSSQDKKKYRKLLRNLSSFTEERTHPLQIFFKALHLSNENQWDKVVGLFHDAKFHNDKDDMSIINELRDDSYVYYSGLEVCALTYTVLIRELYKQSLTNPFETFAQKQWAERAFKAVQNHFCYYIQAKKNPPTEFLAAHGEMLYLAKRYNEAIDQFILAYKDHPERLSVSYINLNMVFECPTTHRLIPIFKAYFEEFIQSRLKKPFDTEDKLNVKQDMVLNLFFYYLILLKKQAREEFDVLKASSFSVVDNLFLNEAGFEHYCQFCSVILQTGDMVTEIITCLKKALDFKPGDKVVIKMLMDIYRKNNDSKALAELTKKANSKERHSSRSKNPALKTPNKENSSKNAEEDFSAKFKQEFTPAAQDLSLMEEQREKERFNKLRREELHKIKEMKRSVTLPKAKLLSLPTTPVNMQPAHILDTKELPELKINYRYTLERCLDYMGVMPHYPTMEITPELAPSLPQRIKFIPASNPIQPVFQKPKTGEFEDDVQLVDNPDVNRIETARRAVLAIGDFFKNIDSGKFLMHTNFNKLVALRCTMYHILRFGEALCPTSTSTPCDPNVQSEIDATIFSMDQAHQFRDTIRNRFFCMQMDSILNCGREIANSTLHMKLKAWVQRKDMQPVYKKKKHPDNITLELPYTLKTSLIDPIMVEQWDKLTEEDKKVRLLTNLCLELDFLASIPKQSKIDYGFFKNEGRTHQSAIKMSISVIAKSLTLLKVPKNNFPWLRELSNLIGHEFGAQEQIRYYEFDEVTIEDLWNITLQASGLKEKFLNSYHTRAKC